MIKLLSRATTAAILFFVFFLESPGPARGQSLGVHRGRPGRRVGTVTRPTPPFNPNAGIPDGGLGQGSTFRFTIPSISE